MHTVTSLRSEISKFPMQTDDAVWIKFIEMFGVPYGWVFATDEMLCYSFTFYVS